MRLNENKKTYAILVHVPRDLYDQYLGVLLQRDLRRQSYNTKIFIRGIEREIEDYNRNKETNICESCDD